MISPPESNTSNQFVTFLIQGMRIFYHFVVKNDLKKDGSVLNSDNPIQNTMLLLERGYHFELQRLTAFITH